MSKGPNVKVKGPRVKVRWSQSQSKRAPESKQNSKMRCSLVILLIKTNKLESYNNSSSTISKTEISKNCHLFQDNLSTRHPKWLVKSANKNKMKNANLIQWRFRTNATKWKIKQNKHLSKRLHFGFIKKQGI